MGIQLEKCKFPDLPLPSQKSVCRGRIHTSKSVGMSPLLSHSHIYSGGEEAKTVALQFIRYMKGPGIFQCCFPKQNFCSTV